MMMMMIIEEGKKRWITPPNGYKPIRVFFSNILSAAQIRLPLTVAAIIVPQYSNQYWL